MRGGIGMRMLQNMGWKQGTPLGRNNEGYVAPITFDVKVGRGGLTSCEEKPAAGARGFGGSGNHLPKKRLSAIPNVAGMSFPLFIVNALSKTSGRLSKFIMIVTLIDRGDH